MNSDSDDPVGDQDMNNSYFLVQFSAGLSHKVCTKVQ